MLFENKIVNLRFIYVFVKSKWLEENWPFKYCNYEPNDIWKDNKTNLEHELNTPYLYDIKNKVGIRCHKSIKNDINDAHRINQVKKFDNYIQINNVISLNKNSKFKIDDCSDIEDKISYFAEIDNNVSKSLLENNNNIIDVNINKTYYGSIDYKTDFKKFKTEINWDDKESTTSSLKTRRFLQRCIMFYENNK